MTRTNFNSHTGQLEQQVQLAMHKAIEYFMIPTWLDQTLQAHSLSETILSDKDKLNSILTDDDIKFYNQNVAGLTSLLPTLPVSKDIALGHLSRANKCLEYLDGPSLPLYEENSIGRKEKLSPFIEGAQSTTIDKLWNVVATYSIHRLPDINLVCVRLVIVPFEDVLALQLKQDEKLAELFIEEKGLMNTAGTHLFKKILEFKSCY